jgi:hypothetical protein
MRLGLVVSACVLAVSAAEPGARAAEDKQVCAASYEAAQRFRLASHLLEARAELSACTRATCAEAIRLDCARWFEELQRSIPTVVVAARDANGADLSDVAVELDGRKWQPRLEGKAMEIDPGEHALRFVPPQSDPVVLRIVARQGEKDRLVAVTLPKPSEASSSRRTVGLVVGGVGVAAIGASLFLGYSAKQQENRMRQGATACAPSCSDADVSALRTKLDWSYGVLAAGAVAVGVGLVILLSSRPPDAPLAAPAFSLTVGANSFGGYGADLNGSF